jgi:hypothetical protein
LGNFGLELKRNCAVFLQIPKNPFQIDFPRALMPLKYILEKQHAQSNLNSRATDDCGPKIKPSKWIKAASPG